MDIFHYLNTLTKKPGAIRNSLALKSIPLLKAIFDKHYSTKPRRFIEILHKCSDLPLPEVLEVFRAKTEKRAEHIAIDVVKTATVLEQATREQLSAYDTLYMKVGETL